MRNQISSTQIADMAHDIRILGAPATIEHDVDTDATEIVTIDWDTRHHRWTADCIRYRFGGYDWTTGATDTYEDREATYTAPSLYTLANAVLADGWAIG